MYIPCRSERRGSGTTAALSRRPSRQQAVDTERSDTPLLSEFEVVDERPGRTSEVCRREVDLIERETKDYLLRMLPLWPFL